MRTLLLLSLLLPLNSISAINVTLDPGHGGTDKGAYRWNLVESQLTLKIAKKLNALLKKDPQFTPHLTRTKNKNISLIQRAQHSRKINSEIFISIHANSSTDARAKGVEFYIQNQLPPNEEALFLAYRENQDKKVYQRQRNWPLKYIVSYEKYSQDTQNILQDLNRSHVIKKSFHLAKQLYKNWQGARKKKKYSIKQAPFYVIHNTNVPSVLIEVGFLSNKREAQRLKSDTYHQKIAQSIYKGLKSYVKDKQ